MDDTHEYETEYTVYPVCPYCGAEDYDPWDRSGRDDDADCVCGNCERIYHRMIHVEVTFSTHRKENEVPA